MYLQCGMTSRIVMRLNTKNGDILGLAIHLLRGTVKKSA